MLPEIKPLPIWPYPRVLLHAAIITAAIVGGMAVWLAGSWQSLAAENGSIENAQLVLLVIAGLLGASGTYRSIVSKRSDASFWGHLAFGIMCVAMVGWVREVQSYADHLPTEGFMLNRTIKRTLTGFFAGAFTVACLHWLVRDYRSIWNRLHYRFLWPLAPFVSCFLLAEVCEEIDWVIAEETVEVFAYSMLALTNGWIVWSSRDVNSQATVIATPDAQPISESEPPHSAAA